MLFGEEHVRAYRESGGQVGHEWQDGVFTLLLTTTGRHSGDEHTTPLIYVPTPDEVDDDGAEQGFAIVASKAGADDHPDWYRNLVEDPDVVIQVGADRMRARARTATDDERAAVWPDLTDVWPDFDAYVAKADREIPVVLLAPTQDPVTET